MDAELSAFKGIENSEETFRRVVENSNQMAMIIDEGDQIAYCSSAWWDFLGQNYTQNIPWQEVIHPNDLERATQEFKAVTIQCVSSTIDLRFKRFDGVYRSIRSKIFPLSRLQANLSGWVSIATDIEEQVFGNKAFSILSESSNAILGATSVDSGLQKIAEMAVPFLGDYCAIDLFENDLLVPRGFKHVDDAKSTKIIEYRKVWNQLGIQNLPEQAPMVPDAVAMIEFNDLPRALVGRFEEKIKEARSLGYKRLYRIPIRGMEQNIGVLTLGMTEVDRHLAAHEIDFAKALAAQIGLGLEKVRLLRREQSSGQKLLQLMTKIQNVQEEERQRVSRDIHDELGQNLTVLKMELALMKSGLPEEMARLRAQVESIAKFVDRSIQAVRKIASELRPIALEDLGLAAALEWLVRDFEQRTKISCRFVSNFSEGNVPSEVSTVVYRVVQEALTNVAKHANTQRTTVGIFDQGGVIHLEIKDYGMGLKDGVDRGEGLGIIGMQERARAVGGELTVSNQPGLGAVVRLRVPLKGSAK